MIEMFLAWRFVRLVKWMMYEHGSKNSWTVEDYVSDLGNPEKAPGYQERYDRAWRACYMAEEEGYIVLKGSGKRATRNVDLTYEGLKFGTFSGLAEALAKSVSSVTGWVAIAISLLALLIASKH